MGVSQFESKPRIANVLPVSEYAMKLHDKLLFILGEGASFNVWPKIICPPEPTTLPTA